MFYIFYVFRKGKRFQENSVKISVINQFLDAMKKRRRKEKTVAM